MGSLGFHRGHSHLLKVIQHTVVRHSTKSLKPPPGRSLICINYRVLPGRRRILNGPYGKNSMAAAGSSYMYFIVLYMAPIVIGG